MRKFERAHYPEQAYDPADLVRRFGVSVDEARAAAAEMRTHEVWRNERYQVAIRRHAGDGGRTILHLSIKRIDREPIHDWRELQAIKNAHTDPEFEVVELYPAESRRVDTANQYHLFCVADRSFRFPFGFRERRVEAQSIGGAKQRPLKPEDIAMEQSAGGGQ